MSVLPTTQRVERSFARALKQYDDNAQVQTTVAKKLARLLQSHLQHTNLEKVFEFGCGSGIFTRALTESFQVDQYIANDLVAACQGYVRAILGSQSQLQFMAGDIQKITLPESCDLICAASTIQWVEQPGKLIKQFSASLIANGYLAISSFGPEHFSELTELTQRKYENAKQYWSLTQWRAALEKEFVIKELHDESITLQFDSALALLSHLRSTGVNGGVGSNWSKARLASFAKQYTQRFAEQGQLPITYQPIYIIAQKRAV